MTTMRRDLEAAGFVQDRNGAWHKPNRREAAMDRGVPRDAVPDGQEGELHDYIGSRLKVLGWLAFHGSMHAPTLRTIGEPDWIVLCPHGRLLLIECKTRTGKLSPEQEGVRRWADRLGHTVHVVRSKGEFEALVLMADWEDKGDPKP